MTALLRLLGLAPQPDARAARHPDRAAALGRSFAACGMTAEEAARAFGKMGGLDDASRIRSLGTSCNAAHFDRQPSGMVNETPPASAERGFSAFGDVAQRQSTRPKEPVARGFDPHRPHRRRLDSFRAAGVADHACGFGLRLGAARANAPLAQLVRAPGLKTPEVLRSSRRRCSK